MDLKSLMQTNRSSQTKTASAQPAATPAASKSALSSAIADAISTVGTSKTASAQTSANPADDLEKMAKDVTDVRLKQAEIDGRLFGVAAADGLVQRLSQWEEASGSVKSASVEGLSEETIQLAKLAQENPEEFFRQVSAGYQTEMARAKQAEDELYRDTYNNTVRLIHKTAAEHYLAGASAINEALQG